MVRTARTRPGSARPGIRRKPHGRQHRDARQGRQGQTGTRPCPAARPWRRNDRHGRTRQDPGGPTTSRPTPPAWTSKKGSLMPMAPVPAITLTPVGYFPENYCLENLAVRADGSVLITAVLAAGNCGASPARSPARTSARSWCTPSITSSPASPRPSRRCSSSACPTATAPIGTVTRQTGTLAKPTATAPIGMVTGCTGCRRRARTVGTRCRTHCRKRARNIRF